MNGKTIIYLTTTYLKGFRVLIYFTNSNNLFILNLVIQ